MDYLGSAISRLLLVSLLLGCWATSLASTPERSAEEHEIKVALLYNILKFTNWPEKIGSGLHICTSGDGKLIAAVRSLTGHKVGDAVISVQPSVQHATNSCQVLVVEELDLLPFPTALPNGVLTVSDDQDFAKHGGMIELGRRNDKVSFIINYKEVRSGGMEISAKVLKLAESVILETNGGVK